MKNTLAKFKEDKKWRQEMKLRKFISPRKQNKMSKKKSIET